MTPQMYWIDSGSTGKLGISLRPRGHDWLASEIEGWKNAGVDAAVSLLTAEEEAELGLTGEARECRRDGIDFHSLPIPDLGVPKSTQRAIELLRLIDQSLAAGQNVVIHCRQGVGRSSTIAAGVLVMRGHTPEAAFRAIESARGVQVPETADQRDWVEHLNLAAPAGARTSP